MNIWREADGSTQLNSSCRVEDNITLEEATVRKNKYKVSTLYNIKLINSFNYIIKLE
jgi:hypothetical protein